MIPSSKPVSGFWHFIRRVQHAFVYHLYVKRALARTDVTTMFGLSLTVPPNVFHPRFFRTTRFLGEYIAGLDLAGRHVLEMGCGSGLLSLLAARGGATVTAVDINPDAVAATLANAAANGLREKVTGIVSDLFEGLPRNGGFDVILWNPPFYPVEPTDPASHAWNAGEGYGVLGRFARQAADHLRPGGRLMIQISTEIDAMDVLPLFTQGEESPPPVATRRLPFETLSIYEFPAPGHGT